MRYTIIHTSNATLTGNTADGPAKVRIHRYRGLHTDAARSHATLRTTLPVAIHLTQTTASPPLPYQELPDPPQTLKAGGRPHGAVWMLQTCRAAHVGRWRPTEADAGSGAAEVAQRPPIGAHVRCTGIQLHLVLPRCALHNPHTTFMQSSQCSGIVERLTPGQGLHSACSSRATEVRSHS
jgi:hypothetical protein